MRNDARYNTGLNVVQNHSPSVFVEHQTALVNLLGQDSLRGPKLCDGATNVLVT